MPETFRFINDGYGWECKRCREAADAPPPGSPLPRFFREGEAEEREPRLSSHSLARWQDDTHRALICPRCGAAEDISA